MRDHTQAVRILIDDMQEQLQVQPSHFDRVSELAARHRFMPPSSSSFSF
jgi:hypothetical protein